MSGVPLDAKEEVRQATDIVELVGSYVRLRRQGQYYVGLCPWHDDNRPSFQVNPDRQSFRCWVCDVGGDVYSFLMRMENVDFREALQTLAERAGIALRGAGADPSAANRTSEKQKLLETVAWAENQFHQCLLTDPIAAPARDYLHGRGVTHESIHKFRLGFSPPTWDWLVARALRQGFDIQLIDKAGLALRRKSGEGWIDRFRNRLIFPIRDVRSRPIAFGGRVLPEVTDENLAKYINSPETPLFSKSSQLYALDLARHVVARQEQIVVMEGYTDVIAAHQAGIENSVAVLGTALGEKHLPLIRRFTDSIALVLDGDRAGQKRTNEILELFVSNQIDLRILTLPNDLDPCDFIATHGSAAFLDLLGQASDALEHKLRTATNGLVDSDNTHHAVQAVEQVLETLARSRRGIGNDSSSLVLREQQVLTRLSRWSGLPEDELRSRFRHLRQSHVRQPTGKAASTAAARGGLSGERQKLPPWDQEVLELLLLDRHHMRDLAAAVPASALSSEPARQLYQMSLDLHARDEEVSFERLMLETESPELKTLLVQLDESISAKANSDRTIRMKDMLQYFRSRTDEVQRRQQISALRTGELLEDEEQQILTQLFTSLRSRQAGSRSTDGSGA